MSSHTHGAGTQVSARGLHSRTPLRLATRLRCSSGASLRGVWSAQKLKKRHKASATGNGRRPTEGADQLREIGVELLVMEGDTIASLSQKYGFSEAKLEQANGGSATVLPGQKLKFVMKAPDNLMPVSTSEGIKLVSASAAYSDDEQESALAAEHRQIQDMQRQHEMRLQQAQPTPMAQIASTARYLGVGAAKLGLLTVAFLFVTNALLDWDNNRRRKTRMEDHNIRAEMRRRHGRSFVEHKDQEYAQDLADEQSKSPRQPSHSIRNRPSRERSQRESPLMPAAPAEAALEETNSSLLSSQQAGASIAHQVTTAQPQPKGAQPNMLHNFQQQGGPANGQAATPGMPGAAQQAQHAQQAEHAQQVHQAQHSQHAWPAQQAHELPQPAQLAQQAVHAPKHAQQPQESQQAQHRADIDSGPANSVPLPQQATSPSSQASVKSAQPQHKSAVLAPSSVAASDAPVDLNSGQEEQPSTVDLSQSGHAQAANDVPTAANASLPLQQASSQDQIPASDSGRPTAAQPGTKQAGSAVSPVPSKHAVGQNDSLDAISAGRELSLNGSQASTDVHRTLRADQQAGAGSSSEPDLDRNGSQGTQNMGEDTQPLPKPSTQILDDMSFPISASEFEVEDMPSDDEHPDMAAGSGNESSAAAAHINSHAPSSQASDAHTANRTETPYTDQHDSTAGSSSPQATHAADTSHEAHASGATDKSASTVNSSGAQTDEDPAEPAWLQLEQLHLPCDEQGHPLTYFVGSEGSDADEEGQERQLCRLMFESESDLKLVTAMLDEEMDMQMGTLSVPTLLALGDAVVAKRPVAFFPAGIVLAAAEHHGKINDVLEWFDQLMTGAEVLPVEASQRLLASRQGPLATQQKQWNAKLKAEEAAAMAEARKQAEEERSRSAVTADRVVPPQHSSQRTLQSDAASEQVHANDEQNAKWQSSSSENHNGSPQQASSRNGSNNGSTRPSTESTIAKGTSIGSERASAYTAMRKGESVQLSKDALNQLDQTSLTQNQELQSKQRQQPKREQTQNSVNGSSPSQTARDDGLKIYYPESDSRHVPLPKRAEKGSWEKLPEVYVPLLRYPSQDVGYMVLDMSTDAKPDKHMLAFESLKDAQMAKRVYQKFVRAVMHVIPMNPNQLKQIVKAERLSTTVYKPGQLRVETGMTQQEFSQAAHLAGPGFESLQEELLSQ